METRELWREGNICALVAVWGRRLGWIGRCAVWVDWMVDWSGSCTVRGVAFWVFASAGVVVVRKWPVAPVSRIRGLRVREVSVAHCGFTLCWVTLL